jgi:hypothetical protein
MPHMISLLEAGIRRGARAVSSNEKSPGGSRGFLLFRESQLSLHATPAAPARVGIGVAIELAEHDCSPIMRPEMHRSQEGEDLFVQFHAREEKSRIWKQESRMKSQSQIHDSRF